MVPQEIPPTGPKPTQTPLARFWSCPFGPDPGNSANRTKTDPDSAGSVLVLPPEIPPTRPKPTQTPLARFWSCSLVLSQEIPPTRPKPTQTLLARFGSCPFGPDPGNSINRTKTDPDSAVSVLVLPWNFHQQDQNQPRRRSLSLGPALWSCPSKFRQQDQNRPRDCRLGRFVPQLIHGIN